MKNFGANNKVQDFMEPKTLATCLYTKILKIAQEKIQKDTQIIFVYFQYLQVVLLFCIKVLYLTVMVLLNCTGAFVLFPHLNNDCSRLPLTGKVMVTEKVHTVINTEKVVCDCFDNPWIIAYNFHVNIYYSCSLVSSASACLSNQYLREPVIGYEL